MRKRTTNFLVTILGFFLLAMGLYMTKAISDPTGIMRGFPYVCIGIGCGLFGSGMGNIVSERALRKDPALKKRMDIEKNDERNITIANTAKGKAYDLMTFVYGALMMAFALMDIDLTEILLLVFSYLFVHGYAIYYRIKLDKEI